MPLSSRGDRGPGSRATARFDASGRPAAVSGWRLPFGVAAHTPASMKPWSLVAAALGALELAAAPARACGVSASGVASCSLSEHLEDMRPHWAVGVSSLYTSTALRFSGSVRAPETRYAALAALAYLPTPRLVLQAGAGATFGGELRLPDGKHEFSPGPTASIGADYRFFDDGRWFALVTSVLSFSAARTQLAGSSSVGYEAF